MTKKVLFYFMLCFLFCACEKKGEEKADQTITFDQLPTLLEGKEFTLEATSTSGLPITFKSTDPSYATVEGNKLKALKGGTTSIIAMQPGNDRYYEAPQVLRVLSIQRFDPNKKEQSITFDLDVKEWKRSQGALALSRYASSTSGLPITFTSSRDVAASVGASGELNIVFSAERQSITIYASQAGDDQYNPAVTVSQPLIVVCDQH